MRSISFPPWSNTSHKHLEQVVDSNIFKPGGCGTVLSVTCNKIQTEEKKECLKTFGDDCKPRIQKNAALLLSQGKKYPFKLGILWDLSLNTIPNSHSEPRGVSVYSGVIIICAHFLRDLESRLRRTAICTSDQISTLSYQVFSIRNILHSF